MALRDTSVIINDGPIVDLVGPAIKAKAKPKKVNLGKIKTLHELLALACNDFDAVLRDKRYAVNMVTWHEPQGTKFDWLKCERVPTGDRRCQVCLAGSVIAKTMGKSPDHEIEFRDYSTAIQRRLSALDWLRKADVSNACSRLYGERISIAKMHKAECLDIKWRNDFDSVYEADNRRDGRRLLAKLRLMQKDLEAYRL